MDSKRCTKCKQVKPLTDFYRQRDGRDGYCSICKACHNARHNEARRAKSGKRRKTDFDLYLPANPDSSSCNNCNHLPGCRDRLWRVRITPSGPEPMPLYCQVSA